ncbi:DUF6923 family protein [Cetobacterium somerae]|uniref:DUF6923 family protein n=1 Tax=Cetobacterium somerae TaxID=188913 RepID=UPI003D7677B6
MKGKYEIYMKNFMFFILFSVLSITIFAIPKDIERYKKGDESIPSTIKKMKAITGSFDRNEVDGFIIQDVGNKKIVVNKKNLVTGENTMTSKDLEVGGNQNNAFGFNSKDDYIYGIQMEIDKGHNLIKIGKNGLSVDFSIGEITGIDKNEYIYVGDFDKYGNMYVAGDYNIYKININSDGTATATDIGNMEFVYADWGYTEINNEERLYFITNDGKLYYYIKNGIGSRDAIFVTSGIETNKGTVVAIFMAGTNMFYNPSGTNKIYRIDLTSDNPKSELFTELDGVTIKGDGARNYLKSIPDLAVGKAIQNGIIGENKERIFTQGDEIRYLLVIKNSGNYFLGQNEESRYTIMDKIDLSKVESTATNVVAKKYKSLTGGTGEVVPSIPTTLSYNSSGEFKLSSETKQLPILDVGERLEIEYTVKIKTYILDDEVDEIKNMVTGTIPNKEIKSDAQATVIVLKPDVLLTKTSDKTGQVVQSGEVIGYTLKLTNGSKVDAKNYVVKDTLLSNPLLTKPEDVLVEGGSLEGDIFESTGGSVTVPAGKTVTITYTVKVPSEYPNETIVNSVNNGEEVVVEYDNPSVSVVKTSDKTGQVVQAGEVIGYTLKLTNSSKVDAKNYVVKDTLLSNPLLTKPEDVSVEGGSLEGDIFESTGGSVTVPSGKTVTITYTVKVPSEYPNETIVNSVNNGEEVVVEYDNPSVSVVKTSDRTGQVVQAGEVIGYTLKLTNSSKVDAKNYVIKDTLLSNPLLTKPEDVSVEGGSLEGDIFESTGGSVTVPAGKIVTITYTVKVPSEYPNETIVNSVNNGEEVVVEYDNPSVSVVKTSDKTGEVVQPGDEIEYTLTLTNTGKTPAINYMVKDTLLTANTGLIKPTSIVVTGGVLTGDIFESEGGTVTVPAQVDAIPGIITIVYTVMVPENYSNKIIVNSVNGGEDITIEVDKPVVRLRHDVFGYEEKFDDSNELINQDKGIVTDFENIENKNSNPPVILPGNKAIHFISLINPSKVDLKGKSDINHQLDGKQLKDDNGNPAFSEHKFQGIVLTNLDTNEKVFYSEKELNEGQAKAKNTREAITLPEANELKITPKTSSFTFEEKIPSRTAISFVFSSTVNSEGTFNKNTRVTSYAFLPFDSEQNTSEGELRKAVITIGRREADLILSKNVEIEEASVGKFVPYTIEIKNMGQDPVENIIISDKIPPGFTYVEGSAVQELKDGYAEKKLQVIGTKEIEIGPISQIKSGETIVIKYLLKVGVGVKPGTYKNIAVVKNENKENISNTDSVDIDIVADPIFEHTTVIGKVFHDRDEDGIQDYADAKKVHISVDIPKEYYIKNTTTVSKDGKNYSFADKYTTITIRNIKGRVSELEPSTNNMVVIRKELIKPIMANVRVQTLGGTDITQQNNGNIITKHIGDKAKGMTSQDIIITQRVVKNKNGQIFLEIFVLNNGIQEEGLPGVRLATPEGIVVETDRFGRYHVPPVAETLGKNYIIKVDPVTLPKGARFTTENPRVRHLGKVMMKFNFGVKLPELKNIKSTKKTLKTITPELFEIPPELLPKQLSDK